MYRVSKEVKDMIPGPEAFQYSDYNENNASANNTYDQNVQPRINSKSDSNEFT